MKELKSFESFFGIEKRFFDNFMIFILGILFEKFHIRARSKTHVYNFIRELGSKRCESFRDEIYVSMCKYEWYLFERDVRDSFELPSLI